MSSVPIAAKTRAMPSHTVRQIAEALSACPSRHVHLQGNYGSELALVLTRLLRRLSTLPLVVLTADDEEASRLYHDVRFFHRGQARESDDRVVLLPALESNPYADVTLDSAVVAARMAALSSIRRGSVDLLVSSAQAWRRRVLPPSTLKRLSLMLAVGQAVGRDTLLVSLEAAGYCALPMVEEAGSYALRGGIVDVFPAGHRFPVRLEFDDDLVQSMRIFDPESQRTLRSVENARIDPVDECVGGDLPAVRKRLNRLADAVSYPSRTLRGLLEQVETSRDFPGRNAYAPAFHDRLVELDQYLPTASPYVLVDAPAIGTSLAHCDELAEEAHRTRLADGGLAFNPDAFFVGAAALLASIEDKPRLTVGGLGVSPEGAGSRFSLEVTDHAHFSAQLRRAQHDQGEDIARKLAERLSAWLEQRRPVVVAASSLANLRARGNHLARHRRWPAAQAIEWS